jgi:hypothetical protein
VYAVELAIDDPNCGAVRVQLRGEREPGRPRTDDQDAELLLLELSRTALSFS